MFTGHFHNYHDSCAAAEKHRVMAIALLSNSMMAELMLLESRNVRTCLLT